MLTTLIQRYNKKKSFYFKNKRLTEILQAVKCHIVLIQYINLLKLSWIIKCLFLRNMEPLGQNSAVRFVFLFLPQITLGCDQKQCNTMSSANWEGIQTYLAEIYELQRRRLQQTDLTF